MKQIKLNRCSDCNKRIFPPKNLTIEDVNQAEQKGIKNPLRPLCAQCATLSVARSL